MLIKTDGFSYFVQCPGKVYRIHFRLDADNVEITRLTRPVQWDQLRSLGRNPYLREYLTELAINANIGRVDVRDENIIVRRVAS